MASSGILNSKEFNYLINKEVPQDVFITKIDSSDIIDIVEDGSFLLNKLVTSTLFKR